MYLFSPYSVEREYGVPYSYVDITAEYDKMVANPNISTKLKLKRVIWKLKFQNSNKSLVIPM